MENTDSSLEDLQKELEEKIIPSDYIHFYVLYIYEEELLKFLKNSKNIEIKYSLFPGINGLAFEEYFPYFVKKRKKEIENNPIFLKILEIIQNKNYIIKNERQLGHIRSFINIIKNAKQKKYKKICILESDVIFSKNFSSKLKNYMNIINSTKLFYLGTNDSKLASTTNFIPFNDNNIKEKLISKKIPNFDEEFIKKKEEYLYKRLLFNEKIEENDRLIKNNIYRPHYPNGTFAVIIDESIYDLILEVLELQIFPTDILFYYIQYYLKNDWCCAYPNIVIADVSSSYILQSRDMIKFSESRGWKLDDYISKY